jgi:ABC-2 type transport system permease protein
LTQAAMLVTFIALMTPSILFSGLMMPVSAQILGTGHQPADPASYFITMVRGVFLKGLGFRHFTYDLLALATFAAAVYGIAILGFRKRAG